MLKLHGGSEPGWIMVQFPVWEGLGLGDSELSGLGLGLGDGEGEEQLQNKF